MSVCGLVSTTDYKMIPTVTNFISSGQLLYYQLVLDPTSVLDILTFLVRIAYV